MEELGKELPTITMGVKNHPGKEEPIVLVRFGESMKNQASYMITNSRRILLKANDLCLLQIISLNPVTLVYGITIY
jgi:hypothetical protein